MPKARIRTTKHDVASTLIRRRLESHRSESMRLRSSEVTTWRPRPSFKVCDLGFEVVDVPAHVAALGGFVGWPYEAVGCPAGEGGAVDAEELGGFTGSDETCCRFRGHGADCRTIRIVSVIGVTCIVRRVARMVHASDASIASIEGM